MVLICMVTRNKAITTTTLHTAMGISMVCMEHGFNLEVQFHTDKSSFHKALKSTSEEKMIWIDYGVAIDKETIQRLLFSDYKVLVVPCPLEGIDWKKFRENPLNEPVHQRGLHFDTTCMSATKSGVSEFVSSVSDGRIVCVHVKYLLKKFREANTQYKSLDHLKTKLDVKIGVLKSANVTCHYVHECFGNIIESSGVSVSP